MGECRGRSKDIFLFISAFYRFVNHLYHSLLISSFFPNAPIFMLNHPQIRIGHVFLFWGYLFLRCIVITETLHISLAWSSISTCAAPQLPNCQRGALFGDLTASGAVCVSAWCSLHFQARTVEASTDWTQSFSSSWRRQLCLPTLLFAHTRLTHEHLLWPCTAWFSVWCAAYHFTHLAEMPALWLTQNLPSLWHITWHVR